MITNSTEMLQAARKVAMLYLHLMRIIWNG